MNEAFIFIKNPPLYSNTKLFKTNSLIFIILNLKIVLSSKINTPYFSSK
nr:MAG TPA: hypothetical protein [Caudoviricetes sp.]